MALHARLLGQRRGPVERSWTSDDTILYALGLGAGTNDLDLTTENTAGVRLRAVPSFAAVLTQTPGLKPDLGDINPSRAVHASQAVRLHVPLPAQGKASLCAEVTGVFDKGKGALVITTIEARAVTTGEPLFTCQAGVYLGGEGGFGGDRGPD